jgi:hypothetical protein
MEIRMKFQLRYVAGASNANYLDQSSGQRQYVPRPRPQRWLGCLAANTRQLSSSVGDP